MWGMKGKPGIFISSISASASDNDVAITSKVNSTVGASEALGLGEEGHYGDQKGRFTPWLIFGCDINTNTNTNDKDCNASGLTISVIQQ